MTSLRKKVTRKCVDKLDWKGHKLVVTLMPGDVISLRRERSRKAFTAPLSKVYFQVVKWHADAERAKKALEKKKKKMGLA